MEKLIGDKSLRRIETVNKLTRLNLVSRYMEAKTLVESVVFVNTKLHFLVEFQLRQETIVGANHTPSAL